MLFGKIKGLLRFHIIANWATFLNAPCCLVTSIDTCFYVADGINFAASKPLITVGSTVGLGIFVLKSMVLNMSFGFNLPFTEAYFFLVTLLLLFARA